MATQPIEGYPQYILMHQNPRILSIMTTLRDRETSRDLFVFYADRLFRLLMEEGLCYLDFTPKDITTPTGSIYKGLAFGSKICGVSVIRAGESMENALRQILPNVRIGKVLIRRKPDTHEPTLYYMKVPHDIADRSVLLLDPMLGTGGSATLAIGELIKRGVKEERICFLNLVAAPQGVKAVLDKYPKIKIVSCSLDQGLNEKKYIVPGLGDFGDRYFGTV